MPLKPVVNVKCPCCHEVLEIDVAKERVVAHRKGKHLLEDRKAGEDALSVALRNQKSVTDRALDDFEAAAARLKKGTDADRIFDEARKKALASEDDVEPTNGA
jgi:hypothetical protein